MELKPSFEDLLEVVYQYYPRASIGPDHIFEGFEETEEYRRLVAARIRAGMENSQWQALLDRLRARFPACEVENQSFHLLSGSFDADYTGKLALPTVTPGVKTELTFLVSILVPYYVIFRQRWVSPPPGSPPPDEEPGGIQVEESFEFSEEEEPYARGIAEKIEATFGYAPMPPALGMTIVPDAWRNPCECGTATLFSYLFRTNAGFW